MSFLHRLGKWVRPRSRARRGLHFLRGGWEARALVLTYHRVVPEMARDPFGLKVTTDHFAAHLACLREAWPVVALDDLVERLRAGRLRQWRQVVITFDDGYADNHRHAATLLREHGLPATFYLTAGYVGTGRPFWWDDIDRVHGAHLTTGEPGALAPGGSALRGLTPPARRATTLSDLCTRLRCLPAQHREDVLDDLAKGKRAAADEDDRPLTWDEARSLAAQGFTVGAHSSRHPALGGLTEAEVWDEVNGSRAILETELRRDVVHFSYPHDDGEYHTHAPSTVARAAAVRAGFASAVSVAPGVNAAGQDLFALRRLTVRDWDAAEFRRQIVGAFRYGY